MECSYSTSQKDIVGNCWHTFFSAAVKFGKLMRSYCQIVFHCSSSILRLVFLVLFNFEYEIRWKVWKLPCTRNTVCASWAQICIAINSGFFLWTPLYKGTYFHLLTCHPFAVCLSSVLLFFACGEEVPGQFFLKWQWCVQDALSVTVSHSRALCCEKLEAAGNVSFTLYSHSQRQG